MASGRSTPTNASGWEGNTPNNPTTVAWRTWGASSNDDVIHLGDVFQVIAGTLKNGTLFRYQNFLSPMGAEAVKQMNWCAACDVFRVHNITNCDAYLGSRPSGLVCLGEPACLPPRVEIPEGRVCPLPCPSGWSFDVHTLQCVSGPIIF